MGSRCRCGGCRESTLPSPWQSRTAEPQSLSGRTPYHTPHYHSPFEILFVVEYRMLGRRLEFLRAQEQMGLVRNRRAESRLKIEVQRSTSLLQKPLNIQQHVDDFEDAAQSAQSRYQGMPRTQCLQELANGANHRMLFTKCKYVNPIHDPPDFIARI